MQRTTIEKLRSFARSSCYVALRCVRAVVTNTHTVRTTTTTFLNLNGHSGCLLEGMGACDVFNEDGQFRSKACRRTVATRIACLFVCATHIETKEVLRKHFAASKLKVSTLWLLLLR